MGSWDHWLFAQNYEMALYSENYGTAIKDTYPFAITRSVVPGKSVSATPRVVKVVWTPLNIKNLDTFEATTSDAQSSSPCAHHKRCMSHLSIFDGTYMIPYGFAMGGEIISSDGSILNQSVISGDKSAADVAEFCYKRISTKHGLLRKSCNGCRPTNTVRLVASPLEGSVGIIEVPQRVMDRGLFTYISENGMCSTRKMVDGEFVVVGRCPSQGPDSAIPMRVRRGEHGVNSFRVCHELCGPTNLDFDGDELYMVVSASRSSQLEMQEMWSRYWLQAGINRVFGRVEDVASANGLPDVVNPAILTTMTFKQMSEHTGGDMYKDMMLKPQSWSQMYAIMTSKVYWKSYVERTEQGVINTVMSRHGLAGPYGFMRMGMMLGTSVNMRDGTVVIDSKMSPDLPMMNIPRSHNPLPASTAMTKLTKIMYQQGIDLSKHGANKSKQPAINSLMSNDPMSYAMGRSDYPQVMLLPSHIAYNSSNVYTNMSSITKAFNSHYVLMRACEVVALVEEIDGVDLTDVERACVSFLLSFLSFNTQSVMKTDSVELMKKLGLDWYTSATCSDVRWIKNVIRTWPDNPAIRASTDCSSLLGSILLGNMTMITGGIVSPRGARTVADDDSVIFEYD